MLAEHLWNWLLGHRWVERLAVPEKPEPGSTSPFKLVLNISLIVLALTIVALGVGRAVAKQPLTEAQGFPAAAVDFMLAQRPPQPIYNEYVWGGYLIWRICPDYRVYIDGRADVYGDKLEEELSRYTTASRAGMNRWTTMESELC